MKSIFLSVMMLAAFLQLAHAQSNSQAVLIRKTGGFGSKPGELKFPTMIAADKQSNLYVVDQHNHRIQKFDSSGNFILMWGKQGGAEGEFNYPFGIAIDSKGDVFVSDMNNNRIQQFSADGQFIRSVGHYGTANAEFKYPYGIAFDKNDVLFVIDAFNYRVQKFTNQLQFISAWGSAESIGIKLYMPHEIAIMPDGNVIMSDRQNHRLSVFSGNGNLLRRIGDYGEGSGTKAGLFSEPHGIAFSSAGDMYVCDRYNFRVQQGNEKNDFVYSWLTGDIFDDSKNFPLGVTVGANGHIYVTDHYAHVVSEYKLMR